MIFTVLPSLGFAEITDSTRQKVEAIKKEFPKFILDYELQKCLDGLNKDSYCDEALLQEVISYRKNQQLDLKNQHLDLKNQQLDVQKQQLNIVNRSGENLEIVIGLIQLGMYVDYDKTPNPQADYIKIIQSNQDTPKEIQQLFTDMLQRHKAGLSMSHNSSAKKILNYAKQYLDESLALQQQITDVKFKDGMREFTKNAQTIYSGYASLKSK